MKKIVSLVLAISMVLSMFVSALAATTFADVKDTKYAGAIEALVELDVIGGFPDGTFKPEEEVTRAQLAKMLVICLGLGDTVEALEGRTVFTDVAENHWASGYINAAVQSKIIAGYPDGTFKPEKEVSYAEAVTMVIRALGYGNVVDKEGVWPTAYMLKAVELELLDDMGSPKAGEAALRGNVAILLWNMLRTPMWKIVEESEGNGMTSSAQADSTMLNVKFPKYGYYKTDFMGYDIDDGDDEAEVKMSFNVDNTAYVYEGLDFYTFVPGTEVEILVNKDDEVLLSIVPTKDNKLVEGMKDEIDEDYDELKDEAYDYAYTLIERRAIADYSVLTGTSEVVDKLDIKEGSYVRINGSKKDAKDYDYYLVIKDGERASFEDLEIGDVLTEVEVTYKNGAADSFYVIGSEEAEGELTRYEEVKYENSALRFEQMTVSKEKYVVAGGATYVEDPEASTIRAKALTNNAQKDKMEGEDVVLILDVFGRVVRVNFDGKIDSGSEEDTTVKFFGVTANVDKDAGVYSIGLENEDDSDTYEFAKNSPAEAVARQLFVSADVVGAFVAVELDDDEKIVDLTFVADYESGYDEDLTELPYGEDAEEFYAFLALTNAKYDKDSKEISGDEAKCKANESTVVVKLVFDDKGTTKETDDEYRVEFEEGLSAVAKIKDENVVVIYDNDSSFVRAKYVIVWKDTSDKSDNLVAKVVSPERGDIYVGGEIIDLEDEDGEEISATIATGTKDLSEYELVVYTITTNSKGKEIFNFVAGLESGELLADNENHGYVGECLSDRVFLLNDEAGVEVDLDSEDYEDYADYMVVLVDVVESEDDDNKFEVSSFEVSDYESVSLVEGDRISIDTDAEVIFVISGMPVWEEEAGL